MGNQSGSLNSHLLGALHFISLVIWPRTRLTQCNGLTAEIGLIVLHLFEEEAVSCLHGCCCGFAQGQLSAGVG